MMTTTTTTTSRCRSATIRVNGVERKIVTWTSRNGYFFTLDRTTGENIVTSKMFPNVNWAQDQTPSERDARAQ